MFTESPEARSDSIGDDVTLIIYGITGGMVALPMLGALIGVAVHCLCESRIQQSFDYDEEGNRRRVTLPPPVEI